MYLYIDITHAYAYVLDVWGSSAAGVRWSLERFEVREMKYWPVVMVHSSVLGGEVACINVS